MEVVWLKGDTPENRAKWHELTGGKPFPTVKPMMIFGRKPRGESKPEASAAPKDTEASAQKPEKQEKP